MARVTGKYDVKFQRGESAFENLMGQYLGIREKRSEERYQRELKDADPKIKLSWVYKLKQEKRRMYGELAKLQRALSGSSGGSWSTTTKDADLNKWADAFRDYEEEHEKHQELMESGKDAVNSSDVDSWLKTDSKNFKTSLMTATKDMKPHEKIGFALEVVERARQAGKGGEALKVVRSAGIGPTGRTFELWDKDTGNYREFATEGTISDERQLVLRRYLTPTASTRRSGKGPRGGATQGDKGLIEFYQKQIEEMEIEIKEAEEDYEKSKSKYSELIRGPSYNRALAPTSIKPSPIGHIIDSFRRLHEVDPAFARDVLTASDIEGEFTVPTPYAEMVDVEGASGQSPLNVLIDATDTMRKMRGLGLKEGEIESRTPQPLTDKDADLVEVNLSQMLSALDSPLYKDAKYGGARDILERSKRMFDFAKGNESRRIEASEILIDAMSNWEGSLDQDDLIKMSKKDQPGFRVADSIRESQAAYDKFLKTRNAEEYRTEIAKTYNDLLKTAPEVRGLVGDAYLAEIERYESVDPSERLPEVLNFKLQGLLQSADVIGARGVLEPGYGGDLPDVGPRSKTDIGLQPVGFEASRGTEA